jgi:heme A synthase
MRGRIDTFSMRKRMTNIHMIVGSAVVVAYVVVLVLNIRTAATGSDFPWQKMVSYGASGLLVVQYMLGFSLLGDDKDVSGFHYLIALAAILPVGMEHGFASQRTDAKERGKIGALANVATLVLVLVAYMIGQSN